MLKPTQRIGTLIAMLAVAGCSSARKSDVLEARLRSQEDMLATYRSEMTRVKTELAAAQSEKEDLRLQLADAGVPLVPAEESGATFRAAGIQFSALMTGGTDLDGEAGHDGLSIVLIPHDQDGELVKLPGDIEIEAFDLSQPGGAQRIGHWVFDQTEIHEYWHKGVIQSGYQFELPWQTPPQSDQVLIHGHLRTANGRKFDSTLTVKVDVPSGRAGAAFSNGIQQAKAEDINPFAVEQAGLEGRDNRPLDPDNSWADGETMNESGQSETSEDRPFFGFTRRPTGKRQEPSPFDHGSAPSPSNRIPRPLPPGGASKARPPSSAAATEASTHEVPPPITDWWADDEWSHIGREPEPAAIRTSDSFTDETIPRYR